MKRIPFYALLIFLIVCVGCRNDMQTRTNILIEDHRILVPVSIGDTSIYMLWDTGSSNMTITKDIADRLNIRENGRPPIPVKTFAGNILNAPVRKMWADTVVGVCESEKIRFQIGGMSLKNRFLMFDNFKHKSYNGMIGHRLLSKYFYAVNFVDKSFCLSDKAIPCSKSEITDSVILNFTSGEYMEPLCRVKINDDSLVLKLDSGMNGFTELTGFTPKMTWYHDLVLISTKDSADRVNRLIRKIPGIDKRDLISYQNGIPHPIIYGEKVHVNSYPITTYIQLAERDESPGYFDGYISATFLLRFDLFYYDPEAQVIKLFKRSDSNSPVRDITIEELVDAYDGEIRK